MSLRWRPLANEAGGIRKSVAFDEKGEIIVRYDAPDAPVKALLDQNATARNHTSGRLLNGNQVRAASIPAHVILKWRLEEGLDVYNPQHADRLMKKLNDPDWAYLRTGGGNLAMQQDGTFR